MPEQASKRGLRAAAVTFCVMLGCCGAAAQNTLPKTPPLPPTLPQSAAPPAPAPPAPPPYDAQLARLAEIMGTLAFMRELCGEHDGAAWHDKMAALLESEGKVGTRSERLAGSYNRGFRGYQLTYRTCTAAAQAVITRSLDEGAKITHELSARFSGD